MTDKTKQPAKHRYNRNPTPAKPMVRWYEGLRPDGTVDRCFVRDYGFRDDLEQVR